MKRIRRFDLLTTDLGHAWVVYDLTQIPAEGSGCRWGQLVSLITIHCGAVKWRRRGSAVECRTLERESPGSNPLHMMAPLMATHCGDNKAKSL